MPEPLVVRMMREHKAAILAGEERAMRDMAQEWLRLEHMLEAQISDLARDVAELAAKGEMPSEAQVLRMERYRRLMAELKAESAKYTNWSSSYVEKYQGQLAVRGLRDSAEAIRAVYAESGGVGPHFNVLDTDSIQSLIGLTRDGSPLKKYLQEIYPAAASGIMQALLDGVTMGLHPTKIAEMMRDALGMGLQSALNTARTESLRAYRDASLKQYGASGVVSGYKRLSAHDERVCAACLFLDGTYVDSLDGFDEHNQGRCTAVPVVIGAEDPAWVGGQDWFLEQNDTMQESILGSGRFRAWKDGTALEDMIKHIEDPTWGDYFKPTPVGEL